MKNILFLLVVGAIMSANSAFADKPVRGYTKKDGTVVQPHTRTNQNKTENDNYSSKGNQNPYTGKNGSKEAKK